MTRRMTFWFDAAACSGCKACQVACKDRHGLEVGRSWRRVSEVTGGGWAREGAAWRHDVFAYHLSISCNHCERPVCLEGCPAQAIVRRDDGVVLINEEHCLGCGYCGWSCPYSAPQYRADVGVMSKCSFCVEDLDAGLEPACVAACPVRALGAGDPEELVRLHGSGEATHLPPLPPAELTEPALQMIPHADHGRSDEPDTEVSPRPPRGLREWSLVAFTVLSQMSAGVALVAGALRWWARGLATRPEPPLLAADLDRLALPAVAGLMALAMVVSLLHLGRPRNVLRAMLNLRQSWLSREILLAGLLCGAALIGWWFGGVLVWLSVPTAILYLGGMMRVYMVRTVPAWHTLMTPLNFTATAVVLGGLLVNAGLWTVVDRLDFVVSDPVVTALSLGMILLQFGVWVFLRFWLGRRLVAQARRRGVLLPTVTRVGAILGALSGLALALLVASVVGMLGGLSPLVFAWLALVLAVGAEVGERQAYYSAYERMGV